MRGFALLGIASLLCLAGCGATSSVTSQPNPVPTITTISPNNAIPGAAAFTLTVNGTNFVPGSIIIFGTQAAATTFVSSTQLTAAIPAAAVASAGTPTVTVINPTPGGGASNSLNFTIAPASTNPVPTIANVNQTCAPVNGPAFSLLVDGSGFVSSSVVEWNGSALPTAFLASNSLRAQVPASNLAVAVAPVVVAVTVFNPAPGGGSSNTSNLTIDAGGASPQAIAIDPTGKFAYVADEGCADAFFGTVSMYSIDAATGALTSIGPVVSSNDAEGKSVSVDPSGKFAYMANWGGDDSLGSVSAFTINATTGALTFTGTVQATCADAPNPGSCAPWSVVVDPSGKFAYVANEGGLAPTGVSELTIDPTKGTLTPVGTTAAAGRAASVTVDPTGKFAYVAAQAPPGSAGNVSMYTIDAISGAFTFIGTVPAGKGPTSVAEDPGGKFVYVANNGSNDVSMYTVSATTGVLTSIGTIAAGTGPTSAAVDPTGKFAYVANSGSDDVSMYTIDAVMGTLTPIGTIAAESSPTSIAIHPSGKFVYVTNSGSNSISMYSINTTTGALTLIGTVGS